jgi:hypothetical protein
VAGAPAQAVVTVAVGPAQGVNLRDLVAGGIVLVERPGGLRGAQAVGGGDQAAGAVVAKGTDNPILVGGTVSEHDEAALGENAFP